MGEIRKYIAYNKVDPNIQNNKFLIINAVNNF